MFSMLGALGGLFSGMGGSTSETQQNFESTTEGTSNIDRTELSGKLLRSLENLFNKGQLKKNQKAVQGSLTALLQDNAEGAKEDFDVDAFVNGIMQQATSVATMDLDKNINLAEGAVGSTQGNNSMAALLANRLRNETSANLAGVKAQAVAEGTKIADEKDSAATERAVALTGMMTNNLSTFLQLLRGAKTKQTQKTKEHTVGSSTSSTSQSGDILSGLGGALSSFKPPAV